MEDDSKYVAMLQEFMLGSAGPIMILDSEKKIKFINTECEDLIGIRESASIDEDLMDVARDEGFAATVIDVCDQSASADGTNQQGEYEIAGAQHNVFATSLIGKDNFAKAFYISFVREE